VIPIVAASYAGVQLLALTGVHQDVAGSQRGAAAGGFIELQVGGRRVYLHAEGVPPVSVPQRPSAFYGQATPQISIADGAVRYFLDRGEHLFIGIGADVINQRTPLPNRNQVVASRLAGVRYETGFALPLGTRHSLEALVGGVPALYGTDIFTYSIVHPAVNAAEKAFEVDYSVAYGLQLRQSEVLVGVRVIDFAAHFTATGLAADRNDGFGLLAEWRAILGH
jgi:hypothetical protein